MNKIGTLARSLDAGEWIASVVLAASLLWLAWIATDNTWNAVVLSLQPPLDQSNVQLFDLVAQRSMNAAAWWMVIISGSSALVGGFGLYLIAKTLQATRQAAEAALQTATASEIAVRPFLLVEYAHIVVDRGSLRVSFRVRNSGASPAYKVAFRTTLMVSSHDGIRHIVDTVTKSRSDIAATVERPASADFEKFGAAEVSDAKGNFLASVEVTLIYSDIFGREHTETSKYGRNLNYFRLDEKLSLYRDVGKGIGWGD